MINKEGLLQFKKTYKITDLDVHSHKHSSEKNILIVFFINFSFSILEFVGAYFTNSMAIFSDALHDLGDSLSLLFSYFGERFSHKKADKFYTFGYQRYSILCAIVSAVILLSGSLFIIKTSIERLTNPQDVVPEGMLAMAILGVLFNSVAALKMSKEHGLNSKMVYFHLLEDVLGWVAILIASIVLMFWDIIWLDPVLSIGISVIVIKGVYKHLKEGIFILMHKFPDEIHIEELLNKIKQDTRVLDVHAVKGHSIDSENFYICFHVKIDPDTQMRVVDDLKLSIKTLLRQAKIQYSTIEFEALECAKE